MDLRSGLNLTVMGLAPLGAATGSTSTSGLGSLSDSVELEVGDLHAKVSKLWSKK